MATEEKSSPSSDQMEKVLTQLSGHGYKVIVEYDDTGHSKISGEIPPRKTFWDYLQLLIIPLALLGIGSWFSYQQNQTSLQVSQAQHKSDQLIAVDQQHATILQTYIDGIQDLLFNHNLMQSGPHDEVRELARARTFTALQGLKGDGVRKGALLLFLYEAGLLKAPDVIIDLRGADLSGIDLFNLGVFNLAQGNGGADLSGIQLNGANLDGANLMDATLIGAGLSYASLNHANLSVAVLVNASLGYAFLKDANLTFANLGGADLVNADLRGANLSYAHLNGAHVDPWELSAASSLKGATMPDGSKHP